MYNISSVSGTTEIVPEPYTSRTCPKCKTVKESSPKGRTFTCTHCNFTFDRDVVGAINIYKKNVSFNQKWLDVVGGLPPPIGIKYIPRLSLAIRNNSGITESKDEVGLLNKCSLEEPHLL